jgi:type IV pilus assembly protein PilV
MRTHSIKKQHGVSLVEILITLVMISIAVLGSASMQVLSKRANNEALQRTIASQLASDMFERMRANRSALENYLPGLTLGGNALGDAPTVDCAAVDTNCDTATLAEYDLWAWEELLDGTNEQIDSRSVGGLLEPTACITGPAGGVGGTYQVAIAWRGLEEHPNPTIDSCGEVSGKYGTNNEYRQVMVVAAFVDDI